MNRNKLVLSAAAAVAAALAVGSSTPALAATPASGAAVISESNAFFGQAALAGVVAVPLPTATASYNSSTGLSGSFPVTGGTASLTVLYGSIQLGGGLLLVDAKTGTSATFGSLAFDVDTFQITGVPQGGTAPVALFDPSGDISVVPAAGGQQLTASDLQIDAAGAQYLDGKLKTSFFAAGQSVGSLTVSYTPAS